MHPFYKAKTDSFIVPLFPCKADKDYTDYSDYHIEVQTAAGDCLVAQNINISDIENDQFVMRFDTINAGANYRILIQKVDPDKSDIFFYTKNPYYLDSYAGTLAVDGTEGYVSDLNMDVFYSCRQPYYPPVALFIWEMLYITGSCALLFLGRKYVVLRYKTHQYV